MLAVRLREAESGADALWCQGSIDRPQERSLDFVCQTTGINKGVGLVLWKRRITGTKRRAASSFILLVSYAGIYR